LANRNATGAVVLAVSQPTRGPYVGRLDTLPRVRRELAKLYREARQRRLDVGDATRLAYVLQVIAKILEGSELERRLEALEAQAGTVEP
jgi:hypothetical protein